MSRFRHPLSEMVSEMRWPQNRNLWLSSKILGYLTIFPRARMGYESIAHEAEGRMGH